MKSKGWKVLSEKKILEGFSLAGRVSMQIIKVWRDDGLYVHTCKYWTSIWTLLHQS